LVDPDDQQETIDFLSRPETYGVQAPAERVETPT
jgi:hypothetical protein